MLNNIPRLSSAQRAFLFTKTDRFVAGYETLQSLENENQERFERNTALHLNV